MGPLVTSKQKVLILVGIVIVVAFGVISAWRAVQSSQQQQTKADCIQAQIPGQGISYDEALCRDVLK